MTKHKGRYLSKKEIEVPKTIKVGGHTIRIEIVDSIDKGDLAGHYIYNADKIILARRVKVEKVLIEASAQSMIAVLYHEVLHAIDFIYNSGILAEDVIDRLSEGWYQVIRDNPLIFKKGGDD